MTTTDPFQKLPTYYKSPGECNEWNRPNTNPRYSNFTQFCFTAGDIDQFETYRNPVNGNGSCLDVSVSADNKWSSIPSIPHEHVDWKKYKNMTTDSVDNTFRYIFDKFKKGLFIKIKDNKLAVFLPFSKHNFTNEWSSFLKQPPSYKTMTEFLIHASKIQGYNIPAAKVNKHVNTWYANNCLVRTEFPVGENDRGLPNIKDMLETLCQTRDVPDIELFINRRDFPLLKTDNTESYEHIFGTERYPLLSHRYDSYAPILSMVTTDLHADIPMPTAEDWARVCSQEPDPVNRKYFAPECRNYDQTFSTPWEDRIPTAVFRGASTGCGTTIETNPRLRLSYLSDNSPVEKVGDKMISLLDAGITKLNLRPRKMMSSPYLSLIEPSTIRKADPLTPLEQSGYKYIVHVDGHVSAFRLSLELSMGSVLLIAESKYRLWFRRYLIPYEHYVPIRDDLSDLFDRIRWCRLNDEKCKDIASNAKKFYERYLQKDGVLDYMQSLFVSIKNTTGNYFYNTISVSSIIREWQLSKLVEIQGLPDSTKQYTNNSIAYHFKDRNYYAMEGLQMVMRDAGGFREYRPKPLHESRDNTRVVVSEFVNSNSSHKLVMKTTSRTDEWVNESFCGISEINKLVKEIPNFRYTYYADLEKNAMISEYVDGVTFKKFIEDGCDMNTFIFILTVISMALAVAQERCGFVHYDLYPWNIIIVTLNEPKKVTYRFQKNIIHVTSHIVPVIIDYGKTHVISDQFHTGTIEPFKTSIFQDCFCLVVSSIYEMTQRKNRPIRPLVVDEGSDVSKLLYIINFFAINEPFSGYDDMMLFISTHKKYNEMIYGNYGRCKLEKKGPIDFFFFMTEKFEDLHSSIEQPDVRPSVDFIQKPVFYYQIITGSKTIVKDITTYLDHVEKCIQNVFHDDMKEQNELIYSYSLSMISLAIDGVLAFNFDFLTNNSSLIRKCEDIKKNTLQQFRLLPYPSYLPVIPYYSTTDSMCLAKYNVKTFSVPQQILTLLQGTITDKNEKLLSFREMFSFVSFYSVPYQISKEFYMKYEKILDINPLIMMNYNANFYTLRMISSKLYNDDIRYLSSLTKPPVHLLQTMEYIRNIV